MKFMFNMVLVFGGVIGAVIAFMSRIVVESHYELINGLNVSILFGVFGIVAFIQGFRNLFASD